MQNVETVEIELSAPQEELLASRMAIILDMAGQGGGKSHIIGLISGWFIDQFPKVRGFIGANTYDQLSGATLKACFEVWRKVYGFTEYSRENPAGSYVVDKRPPAHFQKFIKLRSYKNVISFSTGQITFIGSLENYEAQDGKEYGWAELDETKDTKEEAVKDVILGRLRQIGLWYDVFGNLFYNDNVEAALADGLTAWNPLHIHTSPASGLVEWVNDWFNLEDDRDLILKKCQAREKDYYYKENKVKSTAALIYSAYHNKQNLAPGYLEIREANMGAEKALKLIDGFPFSKSGGEFFPEFNKNAVVKPVNFYPNLPVHMTWDFNVVPYMTCLCSQIEFVHRYIGPGNTKSDAPQIGWKGITVMQIRFYKEYCFDGARSSTDAICNQFKADHKVGTEIFYYGDATGAARKPGLLNYTDYGAIADSLWQYVHNQSRMVRVPNIGGLKRRDLLNDIFSGRVPQVEIIVDPSCVLLIKDFEKVKLGPEGKVKSTKKDEESGATYQVLGHTSDAAEYEICEVARDYFK